MNKPKRDLSGQKFGKLIVLEPAYKKGYCWYWKCKCDCGNKKVISGNSLTQCGTKSCGCLKRDTDKRKLIYDHTGERIGRLVVLEQTEPIPSGRISNKYPLGKLMRMWKVRCDCGVERIIQTQTLRKQKASGYGSCGCWSKERNREERQKHTKPYAFYLNRMQASARPRNVNFHITYEELLRLIPKKGRGYCHYCGDSLIWLKYDLSKTNPNRKCGHNFDRKDNEIGYEVSNLLPCCGNCNRTRGDRFSYEEFMKIAVIIREIRIARQNKLKNN